MLLDALTGLQAHIRAVVLIGAQAVYLRTAGRLPTYQAFTTDADLVIDPDLLADAPPLGEAMTDAGFEYTGEPGIWKRRLQRPGFDDDVIVPVDLIVPAQVAPRAGRRGARLPGGHGNTAARKSAGVEGALVDHDQIPITALQANDRRRVVVNVAGAAALTVAKAYKLGERLATPQRLMAKDAGDVYRLFDATAVNDLAAKTRLMLADERSSTTTDQALSYLHRLFATPRSPGTRLAVQALTVALDEVTVSAVITEYTRDLIARSRAGSIPS